MGRCINKTTSLFLVLTLILISPIFAFNITFEPVNPSYLLQFGENMVDDNSEYFTTFEISNELGDDNSSTTYNTFFAYVPESYEYLIDGWSFNNVSSVSTLYSFTGNNNGQINGELDYVERGDYHGAYFDGTNDYIRITDDDSYFDIYNNDQFTMCAVFDTTMNVSSHRYIIEKYTGGLGYYMRYDSDEQITCRFDGDNGNTNSLGTSILNDGLTHSVCCRLDGRTIDLWIDGVLEDSDTRGTDFGSQQNTQDIFIGASGGTSSRWEGTIHQIGLFNSSLTNATLIKIGNDQSIGDLGKGNAIAVFFNHSFEESSIHEHYLVVENEQTHITTLRVATSVNMTSINSSNYKDFPITSETNFLPINDLIYEGYNYPLRMWDILGETTSTISEVGILELVNDTIPPFISNCVIDKTELGCFEVARLECNVTDNVGISHVDFGYDSILNEGYRIEQANKNDNYYYLDISFSTQHLNPVQIYWNYSYVQDLEGLEYELNPNLGINYTCCLETWEEVWTNSSCLINDTFTAKIEYVDSQSCGSVEYLPEDNGTVYNPPCDYCVSDIQEQKTLCSYQDSTYVQNVSYVDNLYPFCCGVTGLDSDCLIDDSPYNGTHQEFCTIFNNTMDCDSNTYTEYGFFGDKARWICYPPTLNNDTTNCMSYVRDVHSGVIQTNPNYFTRSESIISLDNEIETRTSFEAVGNMVSIYFTKDNLMFDGREYVFGVRCTNNGDYYDYERLISPEYENINHSITRWMWLKENIVGLFFAGIFTLVIVLVVAGYIRELRRR